MLLCQNNAGTRPAKIQIRATDLIYSFLEISGLYRQLLTVKYKFYMKDNEAKLSLLYI